MIKLFVDDIRNPPDESWTVVRNVYDAVEILSTDTVSILSLDHDLGDTPTGYWLACWIEEKVFNNKNYVAPNIIVHSANPVGRANINMAINSIKRLYESRYVAVV